MKIMKSKNFILVTIIGCLCITSFSVYAQEMNDMKNKVEEERIIIGEFFDNWDDLADQWEEKRKDLHEKYYEDNFNEMKERKYCNNTGCWEDDLARFIFLGKNDNEKWDLDKSGNVNKITYENGDNWGCCFSFSKNNGEFWRSGNSGQVIEYKNSKGDFWIDSNFGQSIEYIGSNGEKWEGAGFGDVFIHKNAEGEEWTGIIDDDIDDVKYRNR